MATPTSNKELIKQKTAELGAEAVQAAIKGAGLQGAAIEALQTPDIVEPTPDPTTVAPIIESTPAPKETITAPVETKLPVTTAAPTPTPTPTEAIKTTPEQDIQAWKEQGSDINVLESLIETKYGTVATNENGVITADINGEQYQWRVDDAGNAIKTKVNVPLTGDEIFTQFMLGATPTDDGTPEYGQAKARFDVANQYISMTEDQLYNAYINGEIGSTLEKDLVGNLSLIGAKDKYNKKIITDEINSSSIIGLNAYNKVNGKDITPTPEAPSYLETLSNKIIESLNNKGNNIVDFQTFMSTNYPDLVTDTKDLNAKNTELKKLVDERNDRFEEIVKENPGISLNRATMLAARQNKDVNKQIKTMSYEIGNLQANINYQTTMADKTYGYQLQQQTRQDILTAEQRGMAFNLLQTGQAQQFQQQLIADQRAYEQANKGISTNIITDKATGQQALINSQTGETIKVYDTGLKPTTTTVKDPTIKNIGTSDNPNWVTYNQATQQFEPISVKGASADSFGNIDYSTLDWSTNTDLINQYQGEASFKNNNPTGMTWGISSNLKGLFDDAGIQYEKGTDRPINEGGNYIKFASVQDGLDAYTVALTQAGSDNIFNRLATWVGTVDTAENYKYATDIMATAGIDKGTKFSELNEMQTGALMEAQLQKESPNFYNELANISAAGHQITPTDIMTFNSSTFKPQSDLKTPEQKAAYKTFLEEKTDVMGNKDAEMQDILKYSAGGKDLTDTSIRSLEKFDSALNQLDDIQKQINKMETGPIIGRLKNLNPYDVDAQTLKASLTALIPNLARGVYGEVGVLTDNDIRLYSATIPNLTSTKDVNNAILAMTLQVVAGGYKRQLQSLAAAGKDVSGFAGLYDNLMGQVDAIKANLPQPGEKSTGSIKDILNKYFSTSITPETTGVGTTIPNNINTFITY